VSAAASRCQAHPVKPSKPLRDRRAKTTQGPYPRRRGLSNEDDTAALCASMPELMGFSPAYP
jgi:hypothetical protein